MIKNIQYSDKEIDIFNGLIELIKGGANPYSIKVSDIALASNVGKGTIYDYFSSKEEAISKAIIFNINNEVSVALERLKSKKYFKDRFYELLQIIIDNFETNICTLKMLLSTGGLQEFYEYLIDDKYDLSKLMLIINEEVDALLEMGFKEEIIKTSESKYYQIMAIQGALSGFSHYMGQRNFFENISIKEAMDTSYRILVKSLN